MPQASLPARTVISEAVASDGQNPRHIAEHQRGTPGDTSPPGPARSQRRPALTISAR
jgi:hypothetical protein